MDKKNLDEKKLKNLDKEKLTYLYGEELEPTDYEIGWVLYLYLKKARYVATVDKYSTECFVDCLCEKEVDVYKIELSQACTDAPREDWNCEDGRELAIHHCEKCESWGLTDCI